MRLTFVKFFACISIGFSVLPAHAQELKDLNLPQSGLTDSGLKNRDDFWRRYVELTLCEGESMIVGGQELQGSGDCIIFSEWDGPGFISNMMNGKEQEFDQVRLESEDLSACQFYLYMRGHQTGTSEMLTVLAKPSEWAQPFLALNVTGASAAPNPQGNAIVVSDVDITWLSGGDDPLVRYTILDYLVSELDSNAHMPLNADIIIPFNGDDVQATSQRITELGTVCSELF